jgi:hypothetical protein
MDKNSRHLTFISTCAILGIIVGGITNEIEMNQCFSTPKPSPSCLLQNPTPKRIKSMGFGFLAGAGAASSIAWQVWRKEQGF